VHGTNVANIYDIATVDGGGKSESEVLWRLALVREYQFDESEKDEELFYQCIEQNEYEDDDDAFLRIDDMFRAPNLFIAWKNWRKIDLRIHCKRNDLYVEPKMRGNALQESERINGPYFCGRRLKHGLMMSLSRERWVDKSNKPSYLEELWTLIQSAVYAIQRHQHSKLYTHSILGRRTLQIKMTRN